MVPVVEDALLWKEKYVKYNVYQSFFCEKKKKNITISLYILISVPIYRLQVINSIRYTFKMAKSRTHKKKEKKEKRK